MSRKPLTRVVLTRGISNAGITFIQVLTELSSSGRYVFPLYYAFSNRSKCVVKNRPPESDAQTLRSNNMPSFTVCSFPLPLWLPFLLTVLQGIDLGVIASSLSSTMGSLDDALERMSSTASFHYSQSGRVSFQRVYVAFAGNSDICHSFLRRCADYGESVLAWRLVSIGSPTSARMGASGSHDLRKRTTGSRSEVTGVSEKGLETLEGVGGAGALLRDRTHHGLSAGTAPAHHASPDPTLQSFTVSQGADKDPAKPVIMITPPVGVTSEPIEDRQQILDQNFLPQRPNQSLLQIMWLALKDKILVSSKWSTHFFSDLMVAYHRFCYRFTP